MRKKRTLVPVVVVLAFIAFGWQPVMTMGQVTVPDKMKSPVRLALLPSGNVMVTDHGLEMVLTVEPQSNRILDAFRVSGKPLAIDYTEEYDMVLVGNDTKNCVEVFTRSGQKLYQLGTAADVIGKPVDIAHDAAMKLVFVVDGGQKDVKVFRKRTLIRRIPASDPGNSILTNPTGVAVNPGRKNIYVSDYGDLNNSIYPRIQVFDYDGNLIKTISGKAGMMGMAFSRPQGMVYAKGNVHMVDCFSGELLSVSVDRGRVVQKRGTFGTQAGNLFLPLDVAIDAVSRSAYVISSRTGRIETFK